MEYKLNNLALIETPILPSGEVLMMNIKEATKEWRLWKDVHGDFCLSTPTPPKNSVIWGIKWDEVDE